MSDEMTVLQLQEKARACNVAEFKELLEGFGHVKPSNDPDGETGRDYLKQAVESETDMVKYRSAKLAAVRVYDVAAEQDVESDQESVQEQNQQNDQEAETKSTEGLETARDIQDSAKAVLEAVNGLRGEFAQAVAGYEERAASLEAELAKRDETIAGLSTQVADLTATVGELTGKLKTTDTIAVKAAQEVVKLQGRTKTVEETVKGIKNPSVYKSNTP